jgi:hypothetical protein
MSAGQNCSWSDLHKEIERGLGRLSMDFSKLETTLACAIGYFTSQDISVGHIVAAETGFKAKVALFSPLFLRHTPDPKAADCLKKLRKRLEEAESRRNHLIHSMYWPAPSGPGAILRIKTTAKAAKGLQFQFEEIRPSDIEEAIREVEAVTNGVNDIILDFGHDWTIYVQTFYGAFALR